LGMQDSNDEQVMCLVL